MMERAKRLIEQARATNAKRDAGERSEGYATPHDGPADSRLQIVILALVAGMGTRDFNAVAEGYCMLVDYYRQAFGEEFTGL